MRRRRAHKASALVLLLSNLLLQVAQPHQVNTASPATARAAVATTTTPTTTTTTTTIILRHSPHQSSVRPPPTEVAITSQRSEHHSGQQQRALNKYWGQRSTPPRGIPGSGRIAVELRGGQSGRRAAVADDAVVLNDTEEDEGEDEVEQGEDGDEERVGYDEKAVEWMIQQLCMYQTRTAFISGPLAEKVQCVAAKRDTATHVQCVLCDKLFHRVRTSDALVSFPHDVARTR